MKIWICSIVLILGSLKTFSQQEYFIYLQTDIRQPFYVRYNNKIYSSAESGYLILSKLSDSSHTFTIGFPKNIFPEQQFSVSANRKDAGFLLKNFDAKGWGLLNLQTLTVIMNSNASEEKKSPEVTGIKKNDAFSVLLANAVNDSAILYNTVYKTRQPSTEPVTVREEKTRDTTALAQRDLPAADAEAITKIQMPPVEDSQLAAEKQELSKDSSAFAKVHVEPVKDTLRAREKKLSHRDSTAIARINLKHVKDSINAAAKLAPRKEAGSITKVHVFPVKDSLRALEKRPSRKDSVAVARTNLKHIKDSLSAAAKLVSRKDSTSTAKIRLKHINDSIYNAAIKQGRKDSVAVARTSLKHIKDSLSAAAKPVPRKDSTSIAKIRLKHINDSIYNAEKKQARKDSLALAKKRLSVQKDSAATVKNNSESAGRVRVNVGEAPPKTGILKDSKETGLTGKINKPAISKAAEVLTDSSYIAVYIDRSKEKYDTVRIVIPFDRTKIAKAEKVIHQEVKSRPEKVVPLAKDSALVSQNSKKDADLSIKADSLADKAKPKSVMINSDCKNQAWDSDIDKLRIKMLAVKSDEEKITLAKKLLKEKCFSVKQVKALSEIFVTDEGKYKWFDAAYPFVSDPDHFASLGELIKEEYYLNRFKAMLRN